MFRITPIAVLVLFFSACNSSEYKYEELANDWWNYESGYYFRKSIVFCVDDKHCELYLRNDTLFDYNTPVLKILDSYEEEGVKKMVIRFLDSGEESIYRSAGSRP